MSNEIVLLTVTAASIGFFHTLFGPDHYVPFVVMARSRRWTMMRTAVITVLCGIGHVGSSVVLGLAGVALGIAVEKLEWFESLRGTGAAWALIAFGFIYFVYGIRQAVRNRPHTHRHVHPDGSAHEHEHVHHEVHAHIHDEALLSRPVPWALFVIFVFGPCEPLIPLLMYPAARHSVGGMLVVTAVFSAVTIATMLGVVLLGVFGLSFAPMTRMARFSHAVAGLTILLCGCAIQFLGL